MTDATREPGQSVAVREGGVGALPPEIRQRIALQRMLNSATAQIASLNWGKGIDQQTRYAVASWGRRYNIDVNTEIDVLGNNIYPNARYYLRRLGEMIAAGIVEYAYADHVHADARLAQLGQEGTDEHQRRLLERIKYNVPEDAQGAVVFRVKLTSMASEVVGVNWTGDAGRTRMGYGGVKKTGEEADPIGFMEPAKTAESRAARRCLRQLVSHVPKVADEIESMLNAAQPIQARIQEAHDEVKRNPERTDDTRLVEADEDGEPAPRADEPPSEVIRMADKPPLPPRPMTQEELDLEEDRRILAEDDGA